MGLVKVKRRELEVLLSRVEGHPKPRVILEQYQTPPHLAASLLHTAAYIFHDVEGKTICDLECGTGILAIGASLLGASYVVGLDLDAEAVYVAKKNAERLGVENVDWVVGVLEALKDGFDVVVENPPFGVKKRGADSLFLRKALTLAPVVYSVHKTGNRKYLESLVRRLGGRITAAFKSEIAIPHMFPFHRKPKRRVEVEVYRVERV